MALALSTIYGQIASLAKTHAIGTVFVFCGLAIGLRFLYNLYYYRSIARGLPGPPHHWLFGHLPIIFNLLKTIPTRLHPQAYALFIKEQYNLGDFFYLDTWPVSFNLLVIVDPDITHQITVKDSRPKHIAVKDMMARISGSAANLVSSDGSEWATWRRIFNPGFASSHLSTLVPGIVDDVLQFMSILERRARAVDVFRLEEAATLLTIDIITRVAVDVKLNSQTTHNPLAEAITSQIRWVPQSSPSAPLGALNPLAPFMMWWNTRKMDNYLSKILDERFATRDNRVKQKHVIDLALETYLAGQQQSSSSQHSKAAGLDSTFKKHAICHVKTFLFAGHDTVSGTICYAYHCLSKDPERMAKIRKEHDEVFGSNPDDAEALIRSRPNLLNKLDYTLAVIKEVLRLYPPASTVRAGDENFQIHDPKTNQAYPTAHFMLMPSDIGLHRHPSHFPSPHTFLPERFLDTATKSNAAYIPFSKGPRSCIGQELALLETKIILVMTLRKFVVRPAYGDLKLLRGDGSGWPNDESGVQEVWGDEAYQVMMGSAKPREGYPARVELR